MLARLSPLALQGPDTIYSCFFIMCTVPDEFPISHSEFRKVYFILEYHEPSCPLQSCDNLMLATSSRTAPHHRYL